MNSKRIALGLASVASVAGIVIATAASMERGGSSLDRVLLAGISIVLVLCAHLLPAISFSRASRVLWVGCLLATAWGHAAFFTAASHRAGGVRADAVSVSAHAQALQSELEAIQTRPLALVSADVATAAGRAAGADASLTRCEHATPGQCGQAKANAKATQARAAALADELEQARRGAALRSALADEAGRHDSARAGAAEDPVAYALATLTGTSAGAWSTGVSVLSAVLVELLAALLWSVGLSKAPTIPIAEARTRRKVIATEKTAALPMRVIGLLSAPAVSPTRRVATYRAQDSPR